MKDVCKGVNAAWLAEQEVRLTLEAVSGGFGGKEEGSLGGESARFGAAIGAFGVGKPVLSYPSLWRRRLTGSLFFFIFSSPFRLEAEGCLRGDVVHGWSDTG